MSDPKEDGKYVLEIGRSTAMMLLMAAAIQSGDPNRAAALATSSACASYCLLVAAAYGSDDEVLKKAQSQMAVMWEAAKVALKGADKQLALQNLGLSVNAKGDGGDN